jgi:hypothetical protein
MLNTLSYPEVNMRSFLFLLALIGLTFPIAAAEEPGKPVAPDITGDWQGVWGPVEKIASKDVPAMKLDCHVVRKGDAWQATFEGECGRPYKYTIKMDGRQANAAVLFKGSVDLGEKDGGVYDWIGRADGKDFVGFYTSAKYTGTFRLSRKK